MSRFRTRLSLTFAIGSVLLSPRAATQTNSTVVTNFPVAYGSAMGIGNAIAVDSRNVHVAFYDHGNPAAGIPPSVKYESFPLVVQATPSPQAGQTVDVLNPSFPPNAISVAA